jgi:NAD(P)-dependent dehydrogenase (short-subunit alcohol dehydrogenase family)
MYENLFSLNGKVAAVVGGGGVLAGEMAMGLAAAGADVSILDFNLENAQARAEEINKLGRRGHAVKVDATKKADLQNALDAILKDLGRIDILVNAAGINSATPFFEISEEEWDKLIDVDLKSVFLGCQIFGKAMVDAGEGGSIINISSVSSGPPLSKVFTYGVSKGGVNQITMFLAREFAKDKVRVNAILPGFFPAEQNRKVLTEDRIKQIMNHTPMDRFGDASELVGAAVYLASEKAASFVTGSILRVDGGFMAMTI